MRSFFVLLITFFLGCQYAWGLNTEDAQNYNFANNTLKMNSKNQAFIANYQESNIAQNNQHMDLNKNDDFIMQNGQVGLNENTQVQINRNGNGVNFNMKY